MKVLGIIAEYNPFHNGHFYHFTESKKISGAEACVAVMSGNFTQRGDVAMFSKWDRARAAVDCGIDLILEIPFIYACNNAGYFAKGAVQILNGIDCVDFISFGSESGDMSMLSETADVVLNETPEFKKNLRERLEKGNSFPLARALAVKATAGKGLAKILGSPNNVLAVEYLKRLRVTESSITPITVKRKGQEYNAVSPEGELPSAAAIRNAYGVSGADGVIREYIPEGSFKILKEIDIDINKKNEKLFSLICAKVLTEDEENLEKILSAGEGLGNKIKKEMRNSGSLESLITGIKSKRYTRTRIQRLLIHTLLNLTAADFQAIDGSGINYARVLAFNDKGAALLKEIKSADAGIPVVTNINKQVGENDEINRVLKYDILASDIYNLISGEDVYRKSDFIMPPYHKL